MRRLSALAFRNARARPLRTLLTVIGIVLGVAVILSISVANRSIYKGFEALFVDVAGSAHLTIEAASQNEEGFHQQILGQVQGIEGVRLAVPSTANQSVLIFEDMEVSLKVYGVDPAVDAAVRPYRIQKGHFLPASDKYTAVVVEDVATEHGIEVGEDVTLLGEEGPERLLVVGILSEEGPARQAQIVIPLAASQAIFSRGRKIDAIDVIADETVARSTASLDRLKATIQDEVGSSCEVLYPAARAEVIDEALAGISMGLSFFAVTALFAGAYLIFNTLSMTVMERTREIGMLRAIGATRGQNVRLILTEALIFGLVGTTLGLLFGLLLSRAMTSALGHTFGLSRWTLSVPPGGLVTALVVGLGITVGSALIPAIRAGRISPIQALAARAQERKTGWLIRHSWKAGLALVILAELSSFIPVPEETAQMWIGQLSLLMLLAGITLLVPRSTGLLERLVRPAIALLYGQEGKIGGRNVNRALGRTTITVGALTMGILTLVMLGAQSASMMSDMQDWVNAAMQGDLFIESFGPMRLDLRRELAEVEGVHLATPMRYQPTKVVGTQTAGEFSSHDDDIGFIAIDPLEYTQICQFEFASGQGDEQVMLHRLVEGNVVFISTTISDKYGIGQGDTIRLRTSRGERDFAVAGVIVDYNWGGWTVTGSWRDLERYFRTNKAHVFVVDVAPGAPAEEVGQRLEEQYGQRRHIEVTSGQEYRGRWLKEFTTVYRLFDVIVGVAIVIAALGVTNTMTMNVLERMQEIGCLRAVGMTRWQVVRMVLAEALIIGILGGLLGVTFGSYLSFYAVQGMAEATGWEVAFVLPTRLLLIGLALALGVSQVASLYPAWRAARANIVRAVQYE